MDAMVRYTDVCNEWMDEWMDVIHLMDGCNGWIDGAM